MTARGAVTLVFDDGYEQVYQQVLPLLRQYRMPAVFALPLETEKLTKTTGQVMRPWQDWQELSSQGYELAAHSVSHVDLTTLDDIQLDEELHKAQQAFGATTLVYPGGAVNEKVFTKVAQYYSAARGLKRGFEALPPKDPLLLHSYDFTRRNFTPLKANALALWAYLSGSWLIETYHVVDDSEAKLKHTVRLQDLKRHLQFLSRLPIAVRTIHEVVKTYGK
jgi:peptidoglycan/xylan/chitin deacetylase (PgdA/CDA1 family)